MTQLGHQNEKLYNMDTTTAIQTIARMFYKTFVIAMILMIWDPKAIWGLPLGLIVGICCEANNFTNIKPKP